VSDWDILHLSVPHVWLYVYSAMKKLTTSSNPASSWALTLGLGFWVSMSALGTQVAYADKGKTQEFSTVSEEVPEEVLQIQVGTEANSVLTGQPQTVDAYTQEQRQLQVKAAEVPPQLAPSVYRAVELLRLLKVLKGVLPFL
jgi:hypothetical protein